MTRTLTLNVDRTKTLVEEQRTVSPVTGRTMTLTDASRTSTIVRPSRALSITRTTRTTTPVSPVRTISVVQGATGPTGPSGDVNVLNALVELQWGTPSSEAANTIEITGSILDFDGAGLSTSLADIRVIVTDGAADAEPSATAYITAASSPVGTILSGSGTATAVIRSASGSLKIAVHEASAGNRYLWVGGAGHERLWVRAADGVQELVFA